MLRIGTRDFPTNRGGLCQKGWTAAHLLSPGERLTRPLMRERREGALLPVSWDVALDRVADEFRRVQATYGRDSAGVFGGGGLTNEKAYWLGKFARVARSASHPPTGRVAEPTSGPRKVR
jgi:assimilatory nitrate reductase catalytic subunit